MSNIKKLSASVVRIIADNIIIDWSTPFQILESNLGSGTGFFIDNKGHILTCAHVVTNAHNVLIEIPNQGLKKFDCDVLGICPDIDLALLKIKNYKNKSYLKLGSIKDVNLGSEVIALGFPQNYNNDKFLKSNNIKLTKGVISGQQFGIYQTDSAINPGNSGGPLILKNKVIGINSSGIIESQNIGYSIPIDYFINKKEYFMKSTRNLFYLPQRCFNFNQSNESLLKIKQSKCKSGIYISNVYDNSNVKKLGLSEGSILCKINNNNITNDGLVDIYWFDEKIDINSLFLRFKINQKIKIEYFQNNKLCKKNIINNPYKFVIREKFPSYENIEYQIFANIVFMNLSINHLLFKQEFQKYNTFLSENKNRTKNICIVSHIYPNSSVSKLNSISISDNIVKINDIEINSVETLTKALEKPILYKKIYYVKIQNNKNNIILLKLKDILLEDIKFSKIYNFPLSTIHQELTKKCNIKINK